MNLTELLALFREAVRAEIKLSNTRACGNPGQIMLEAIEADKVWNNIEEQWMANPLAVRIVDEPKPAKKRRKSNAR